MSARPSGSSSWASSTAVRDPAALPGWIATTTRRECCRVLRAAQQQQAAGPRAGHRGASRTSGAGRSSHELLMDRALRPRCARRLRNCLPDSRRLIALLIQDPPVPYAEISAKLGIPVGSIGPHRGRCLEKLRRYPAIAALINV